MLRVLIQWLLKACVFPIWLIVTVIHTIGTFLTGFASWFFYLVAGIAVITAFCCVGFQLYTWQEVKNNLVCALVFILIPNVGMWILTGLSLIQCGLQSFLFE